MIIVSQNQRTTVHCCPHVGAIAVGPTWEASHWGGLSLGLHQRGSLRLCHRNHIPIGGLGELPNLLSSAADWLLTVPSTCFFLSRSIAPTSFSLFPLLSSESSFNHFLQQCCHFYCVWCLRFGFKTLGMQGKHFATEL